jgi:hypothetical protein
MNVVQVLNVKLQRADQSVSWGFNLQGGKDFCSPLLIQKVKNTFLVGFKNHNEFFIFYSLT